MADAAENVETTEMNAGTPQTEAPAQTDWRESIPEQYREWDEVKNSDSPEKFWGQVENMRGLIGQSIRIPSEEAGEEAMNAFYQKLSAKVPGLIPTPDANNPEAMKAIAKALGAPEKPEDYKLPDTEGVEFEQERVDLLRGLAHEYGLTAKQFEGIMSKVMEVDAQGFAAAQAQAEAGLVELQKEWGQAYDGKVKQAEAVRKQFFEHIPEGAMGAQTIKALSSIAEAMGGEHNEIAGQGPGKGALTPAEAEARIGEIMDDSNGPYWRHEHPGHEAAVKRVVELQKMITNR